MIVVQLRKQPRKRRWPWVLLVLFILPIIPLAIFYFMLYDDMTKNVKIQENFTVTELGTRLLVDCMDNTPESHKIDLAITENDIDNVLAVALKNASSVNKFVKKAYLEKKDNNYNFFIDLDLTVIRTRIKMFTVLEDDVKNDRFIFLVKDIAVGQITGLKELGKNALGKYVSEDTINKFITQSKLSIKYVAADSTMYYNKGDLMNDVNNLAGSGSAGMFMDIMKTMMEEKLFSFNNKGDIFIGAEVNLERLANNDLVTDDPQHLVLSADKVGTYCRDKLVALVNANALEPTTENLNLVFKYLFHGYDVISDSDREFIDTINMTSIGITDKSEYKGFNLTADENDLIEKMKSTLNIPALIDRVNPTKDVCYLLESDVNSYIKGKNVLGYTTLLHRQTDDTYKINFVTIDNFYCNIYDKHSPTPTEADKTAEFVCKLNVNGYHTSLTFDCHVHDTIENNKITFYVDNVSFGEMNANNLRDVFFGVIEEALKGTPDNSLTANKEDYSFSFDFNYILGQAEKQVTDAVDATFPAYTPPEIIEQTNQIIHTAFTQSNAHIDVTGDTREDDGGIKISLPKTIWEYTPPTP